MALPRVEIPNSAARTGDGTVVAGANVQVNKRGSGVPADVFATEPPTDVTPLPQPLTTSAAGEINGWIVPGQYRITVSGTGITTAIRDVDLRSGVSTPTWTISNMVADRTFDPTATTLAETAQVLATLIGDLKDKGDLT